MNFFSKNITILYITTVFLLSGNGNRTFAQNIDSYCIQANATFQTIEKKHYKPITPNNQWGHDIYKNFIEILDPQGMLFTQADINILEKLSDSIDDYVMECRGTFLSKAISLYRKRLWDADTLVSVLTENPLNFAENDTLKLFYDDIVYAKNPSELKERWINLIKYRTLYYIYSQLGSDININNIMSRENDARKIIKRKIKQRIKRYLDPPNGFENQVAEQFYNAIAQSFDPHTTYFSITEKNNFESDLTTSQLSYGFEIDENDNGDVYISRLVPGGPAWKSNELHKGDILVQVKWPDTKLYDLTLMDGYEIDALFESAISPKMDLTVRKANGQIKTIHLAKEKISSDENTIKSLILKGSTDIGYISLPGFYTEMDNDYPAGCATDMAKEVMKLKKENVDGIIFDLRFNGGGSMGEAIALAVIFINEGPLCVLKNGSEKPSIIKDINRGTIYDGPLLLMVNGYSASASEILAGCLQDYHRAIIAGSRTYGKATSQIIVPIEQSPENYNQPEGYVKITTGKIYRITGKSHQINGVMPDILLPEYFEMGQRESDSKNALEKDSITKKISFNPLPSIPIDQLNRQSKLRIMNIPSFRQIENFNDSIGNNIKKRELIALNWNSFLNGEWKYYQAAKKLDSFVKEKTNTFTVTNNKYDKQVYDLDPYKQESNNILVKNVENDIYIEECYHILDDFITFKKVQHSNN